MDDGSESHFNRKSKGLNVDNSAEFVVTKFDAVTGFDAFQTLLLFRFLTISQTLMLSKC